MKVVFVLFDSLVRRALGCYGGTAIATPNFDRFASKAMTFDTHYVGSLPCKTEHLAQLEERSFPLCLAGVCRKQLCPSALADDQAGQADDEEPWCEAGRDSHPGAGAPPIAMTCPLNPDSRARARWRIARETWRSFRGRA